jgi:polyisoprenoid-binding protein YceI
VGELTRPREPANIATGAATRKLTLVPHGTWEVDAERSAVGFEIRHLKLMHVRGSFHVMAAVISCDREGVASIAGSIGVASIDTGDPRRDARLCDQDFFDVEHHPLISFSGVSPPVGAGDELVVRGTMTMRGASRPLELTVEQARTADGKSHGDPWVRARGVVSRHEFGLDWDSAFATGGLVIDDRVALRLDVVLVRRTQCSQDACAEHDKHEPALPRTNRIAEQTEAIDKKVHRASPHNTSGGLDDSDS